ncbi:HNH endonuclease [Thermodesulfobacteriota bacterium]
MDWIFQGNPTRFKMDEYLAKYPYIYWRTPTNQREFKIGDIVFMWRATIDSGVVALGRIAELPTQHDNVLYPDALGDDLWIGQGDRPSEIMVGVNIDEVRLTIAEGMIPRPVLKNHAILSSSRIIRQKTGSVFLLSLDEVKCLLSLWAGVSEFEASESEFAIEGNLKIRQHYSRERSQKIIDLKKDTFLETHDSLVCELCDFNFSEAYPETLGENYIEVHHIKPVSEMQSNERTTLDDLMLVCSNCHRMIHRTKDCTDNLNLLQEHFNISI